MSTAQPPHREEDSSQALHAASQQAGLSKSYDWAPGEKKAWAKKARRRHSVVTTKFTRHETSEESPAIEDDKLSGRSSSFAEDPAVEEAAKDPEGPAEEAAEDPEGPIEDSAEELEVVEEQLEEADEEQPEELAEDPEDSVDELVDEQTAEDLAEEAAEEVAEDLVEEEVVEGADDDLIEEEIAEDSNSPKEDLGEYVDDLSQEFDALDELEESEEVEDEIELTEDDSAEDTFSDGSDELNEPEEPENELPVEPLPVDSSSENEQAEDLVEEFEIKRERIPREQPNLQAHSWGAAFKSDASGHPKLPSHPKPTKCEKPKTTSVPAPEPAAPVRQKPTKCKKPVFYYRYIKSPSLEQAFRNLLRLDAGAAWRATRIPLVAFFLCFALLALAIADQAPAIDSFNATINALVHGTRGLLDSFFVTITTLGDLLPMTALCLVVCAILAIARKWDSLAFFATNVILAVVCVQALKLIFAVPRPGAETLVPIPGSFSFPSAHSFCSLIVFGMIGLLIFRALNRKGAPYNVAIVPGIILVIFAILIGISRIYVGVHWPSDVLGGWLLAGMWLPFASALYTVGARKR